MKIAVVHSFYSRDQPSGENSVVEDQVATLRSAGHEVLLLDRHTDYLRDTRGYELRAALTTMTGHGPKPGADLSAFKPDILHVHNTFPNWGTSWLGNWATRTVATLHNFRPICAAGTTFRDGHSCLDCLITPVIPAVRHRCYRESSLATLPVAIGSRPNGPSRSWLRHAGAVAALTADAARLYRHALGRDVHVLPNFVHPAPPPSIEVDRWVYVGRLTAEKGILALLNSWPTSRALDVIGDGPLKTSVAEMCAGRDNLAFVGPVGRGALVGRLGSYRGLIMPSLWPEGLPTVLLEALAAGLPSVISQYVSASSQLVQAGAAVTFEPRGSAPDLESVLGRVDRRRAQMSSSALATYEAHYSPQTWTDRVECIYAELIERAD